MILIWITSVLLNLQKPTVYPGCGASNPLSKRTVAMPCFVSFFLSAFRAQNWTGSHHWQNQRSPQSRWSRGTREWPRISCDHLQLLRDIWVCQRWNNWGTGFWQGTLKKQQQHTHTIKILALINDRIWHIWWRKLVVFCFRAQYHSRVQLQLLKAQRKMEERAVQKEERVLQKEERAVQTKEGAVWTEERAFLEGAVHAHLWIHRLK